MKLSKKPNWARPTYWQSQDYNLLLMEFYQRQLENLAMSRFRWEGLPEKVDVRFLEWTLNKQGVATIAWPNGLEPANAFSMQAVLKSSPDANYNYPTWVAQGINGVRWDCERGKNGVIVWSDMTRTVPLATQLKIVSRELADITRTMQMIRMHMRVPYIITGPKSMEQQMRSLWTQIADGEPAIIGYDNFDNLHIDVIQTEQANRTADLPNAQAHFIATWAQALRLLGIRVSSDKAARQTADEVVQQNDMTDFVSLSYIEPRREACRELNKLTGGNATVTWNKDVESLSFNALANAANFLPGARPDTDTGSID